MGESERTKGSREVVSFFFVPQHRRQKKGKAFRLLSPLLLVCAACGFRLCDLTSAFVCPHVCVPLSYPANKSVVPDLGRFPLAAADLLCKPGTLDGMFPQSLTTPCG